MTLHIKLNNNSKSVININLGGLSAEQVKWFKNI
jgi:hypothetical protein